MTTTPHPGPACEVFAADDIFVSSGANLGDGLEEPDLVCPGDIYELARAARSRRLLLAPGPEAALSVAPGSPLGAPGAAVRLAARYTLMTPEGQPLDLLLLRLDGPAGGLFAAPLSPLGPRIDYTLVQVDAAPPAAALNDLLCVSFVHGTMITLACGSQRPIETLRAGDRVLTRDHGPQPIRWIGHATQRALGALAPVVIPRGTLGNSGDLIVSQHHRIFLYRPGRRPDMPTAELLVQARHLVDGSTVYLREGGMVDYFSLVFDWHEIIYAEGIPAESLRVTEATVARLPQGLSQGLRASFPGLAQPQHFGTEANPQLLDRLGPAALFRRRASTAAR